MRSMIYSMILITFFFRLYEFLIKFINRELTHLIISGFLNFSLSPVKLV